MAARDEQIAQLRAAIAAFEAQRPALGEAVVEAGLGPLHERLSALLAQAAEPQRKMATMLFMDIVDHTRLVRDLDPEETMALMDPAVARLAEPIRQFGGRIARYQGDGFKAIFGLPAAQEDDPESAVRAALAIQEVARAIVDEWAAGGTPAIHSAAGIAGAPPARFQLRIGIDTGLVFAGGLTEGIDTVTGMPVNLAARLEAAAEPGTILISHNTYRHVRGIFDVQPRDPILVKGVDGPVQTYIVRRAKPRAFRMTTRGVDGVETRMIGRERELALLQGSFFAAVEGGGARLVAVVGEAGLGKSRLLYEFDNWLELRPETTRYFKGRARPALQGVAYSLFRDLFAFRFDILDSDPTAVALEKFRAGMAGYLPPQRADVVGHWLGFDFSSSEAVRSLLGSAGFATAARTHLTRYFRALAGRGNPPVVVILEDVHWADDPSLDLIAYLAEVLSGAEGEATRLLFVAATRPTLFERRPDWDEDSATFGRISLTPLSEGDSGALLDEILRCVEGTPERLRALVVNAAEGNPFYVEELVKMLIEQGVIQRGGAGEPGGRGVGVNQPSAESPFTPALPLPLPSAPDERWHVWVDRLEGVRVPSTLTGLLQARLDGLPEAEREALRRAAVVGRLFWDDTVADLLQVERETLDPTLEAARRRGLIYHSEHSSFAGVEEYLFQHALLRDVAYETVLLKRRAELHGRVARWLEAHAGERLGEYLGLIAGHYAQAGEGLKAAALLERSGEEALRVGAVEAARRALERALALREAAGETGGSAVTNALLRLSRVYPTLGDLPAAEAVLERALAGARATGDVTTEAEALAGQASIANARGEYDRARALVEASLPLGRAVGGQTLALILHMAAYAAWSMGDLEPAETYAVEALATARALGAVVNEIEALNVLGNIATSNRDLDRATEFSLAALALSRLANHLTYESRALLNLGYLYYLLDDLGQAEAYSREALTRSRELGGRLQTSIVLGNLAQVHLRLDNTAAARAEAHEALTLAVALDYLPAVVNGVSLFGQILAAEGTWARALALFGVAYAHPALEHQLQLEIEDELARLVLPSAEVEAGLAAGEALDFETVVQEILNGQW